MHRLELYAAEVHRFVERRVANVADAADIAQQTLVQACANLSTFRGDSLRAWLFTIAQNLIVDHYRAQKRFQFVEVERAALAETEPALHTAPGAVRVVCESRERLRCWLDCVTHRLRLEQQIAVLLADIYGYRDRDSAVVLSMSLPCFKLLLHGARARLHEVAGGSCALVSKTSAAPSQKPPPDQGGEHPVACRLGVTCRISAPALLALRGRLLKSLRLTLALHLGLWLGENRWVLEDGASMLAGL